jgi:hypothetical protein
MSFEDAIAQQPQWVQIWVKVMTVVVIGAFLLLLFSKATRRDSLAILIAVVPITLMMQWLYDTLGYTRLLGLPHVIFWTPLAAYLWWRLSDPRIYAPFRQVIWLLLATITVSLAFDYVDVARYLLGERAALVTPA